MVETGAEMVIDHPLIFVIIGVRGTLGLFGLVAATPGVDPRRYHRPGSDGRP